MTDLLETRGPRQFLHLERRFAHPPAKVWRALTDPAHLGAWYPATITAMEPRLGGTISLDYGGGFLTTAEITAFDPPRLFAFTERPTTLVLREPENRMRLELIPHGDGTLLLFEQLFSDRPAAASYAAGWQGCFDLLDQSLGGVTPTPVPVRTDRHQHYVKLFGLDQGSAVDTTDGWEVCFVRQLMQQPVPQVWAALTGHTPLAPGDPVPAMLAIDDFPAETIAGADAPYDIAYVWKKDDRVAGCIYWKLTQGPGGARIEFTQTGPLDTTALRDVALLAWRDRIESIVDAIYAGKAQVSSSSA